MSDGDEGSDKSDKDSDEEKEDEEEEDGDDEDGGIPKWVPKKAIQILNLKKKNRIATVTNNVSWNGNVIATKCTKYALKFLSSNCGDLMIGFAPSKVNVNQSNYSVCGWYYYTTSGTLYSQDGDSNRSFTSANNSIGTIYGFALDKKKGTITIYRAGQKLGLAYTLKDKKLAKDSIPNVNCYYANQSFELVKFK